MSPLSWFVFGQSDTEERTNDHEGPQNVDPPVEENDQNNPLEPPLIDLTQDDSSNESIGVFGSPSNSAVQREASNHQVRSEGESPVADEEQEFCQNEQEKQLLHLLREKNEATLASELEEWSDWSCDTEIVPSLNLPQENKELEEGELDLHVREEERALDCFSSTSTSSLHSPSPAKDQKRGKSREYNSSLDSSTYSERYSRSSRVRFSRHMDETTRITKSYFDLERVCSTLAKRVLAYYFLPQNTSNYKVHLCGLCLTRECNYFSYNAYHVQKHIMFDHSRRVRVVTITHYPEYKEKADTESCLITYSCLQEKNQKLALRVFEKYNQSYKKLCTNPRFCGLCLTGECNYISCSRYCVLEHIKLDHPKRTEIAVYTVIHCPSESI